MNDRELDKLLNQLGEIDVKVEAKQVIKATHKQEKRHQMKLFVERYGILLVTLLISTVLTLLSGWVGLLVVGGTKEILGMICTLMGMTQVPIVVFLVSTIQCQEIKK